MYFYFEKSVCTVSVCCHVQLSAMSNCVCAFIRMCSFPAPLHLGEDMPLILSEC